MATPNKRQHWVPQFYLRYFATEETRESGRPQVWATPIGDGPVFRPQINKVAAKGFLYSPLLEDGTRDDRTDRRLQHIESVMGQLWPRIAHHHYFMDDPFRKGMSLFLATMLLRNPRALAQHCDSHAKLVSLLDSAPKDAVGNPCVDRFIVNGKESRVDVGNWAQFRDRTDEGMKKQFADSIMRFGGRLARVLLNKRPWNIVFADQPAFATSDHPVALYNEHQRRPGVARPDTMVFFPISPTRMLVIGEERWKDGMAFPLRAGGEGLFNLFVYRSAHRFLFTTQRPHPTFDGILHHMEALVGQPSG